MGGVASRKASSLESFFSNFCGNKCPPPPQPCLHHFLPSLPCFFHFSFWLQNGLRLRLPRSVTGLREALEATHPIERDSLPPPCSLPFPLMLPMRCAEAAEEQQQQPESGGKAGRWRLRRRRRWHHLGADLEGSYFFCGHENRASRVLGSRALPLSIARTAAYIILLNLTVGHRGGY